MTARTGGPLARSLIHVPSARTEQYWLAAVRLSVICGRGAAPKLVLPRVLIEILLHPG